MTRFSDVQAKYNKFDIKYENDKLFITVKETVSICDLSDIIFYYCLGGSVDTLRINKDTILCEVKYETKCFDLTLTKRDCVYEVLEDISRQINI